MSRFLYRVGFGAAAHPWRTICAWVLVAGATIALATSFGGTPHDDYDIPDARAQQGIEMLRAHTPGAGDATARVVVHDRDGTPLTEATLAGLRPRSARWTTRSSCPSRG